MNGSLINLNELLIGDKLFDVPVYQRSYAWERKNLEDLWEDIYFLEPSKRHFFGTVLLKDSNKTTKFGLKSFKRLDVIDGQQRLTTVLILLREIITQMKALGDPELRGQVSDLEKSYLKDGAHYKLNLQENDAEFFKEFVIDNREHPSETETISQRRLMNAKLFFRRKLNHERKKLAPCQFEDFLVQFKQRIDELQLIQYLVNSESDAIRIFETSNDRGKPLSNLEKTKSFLMHTSYLGLEDEDGAVDSRLKELNKLFSRVYRRFEDVNEAKAKRNIEWLGEDDIQRYHFISFISSDRDKSASTRYMDELKDIIRTKLRQNAVGSASYAFEYAKDLAQTFQSVKNIVEMPEKEGDTLGRLLSSIFMIGRLGNIFPLLITSWLRFGKSSRQMSQIVRLLEAFTFRAYVVGGRRSDTGITRLNNLAHKVHQQQMNYGALIGELKSINDYYATDRKFESDLRSEDFYTDLASAEIKYLLSEYETDLRDKSGEPLSVAQEEILSAEYQVEHIWAQDASKLNLSEPMKPQHEQNVHKLGNLTLASKSWNASMGNKSFKEKSPKYKESSLRVQRELASHKRWNHKTIRAREGEVIAFAMRRWSIS